MGLKFPTIAEQVLRAYEERRIRSIAVEARRRGADVEKEWIPDELSERILAEATGEAPYDRSWIPDGRSPLMVTLYTFDDDSSIRTTGRGRSYTVEALLP